MRTIIHSSCDARRALARPALLATLGALLLLSAPASAGPPIRSKRIDKAVARIQPAVVKVFGVKGFRGVFGYMTGVNVHQSGLVITRGSVTLDEAPQIKIHFHDGRRVGAEIVREDRVSKMILLRLLGEADDTYPVAPLADSDKVKAGHFSLLIGNAYKVALGEEKCAVNLGVVSAVTKIEMRAGMSGGFDYDGKVILHDAMNNPGVYGGPLANLKGEVIGISGRILESRETNVQMHYAIPVNDLKAFILDTINNPEAGKIYRRRGASKTRGGTDAPEKKVPGWHGIRVLRGGINKATPAYIDRIVPQSPAHKAGLRADDLVLKIDHMRVKSWRTFNRMMGRYQAGEKVQLTIKRRSDVKVIDLTLGKRK